MDSFKSGWFTETGVLNSNSTNLSIKVENIIHSEKSKFQNILVFKRFAFYKFFFLYLNNKLIDLLTQPFVTLLNLLTKLNF
jgi:hypothetical protein